MNNSKLKRVDMLDYLRGIMALSVLVYHYLVWSDVGLIYPLDQMVSRLGLYAVSAFYVLSGASLAYVYCHKQVNKDFVKDFGVKRIFRIAPLLWIATTATIILDSLGSYVSAGNLNIPDAIILFLNYTLTFGWLSPDSYIATGAWSIGNELVFYSLFPIMLYLITKSHKHFAVFGILSVIASFLFSEVFMSATGTLTNGWSLYINPLNQLYLFVGGFLIGYLLRKGIQISKKILLPILVVSILVFALLPIADGDRILYVTGINKVIFSLTIFGMALFAAFWGNIKQNFATITLKYFGDISYSVYLMHPLAYTFVGYAMSLASIEGTAVRLIASVVITIITATVIYKLIERPFVKMGRGVSKKITTKVDPKIKIKNA